MEKLGSRPPFADPVIHSCRPSTSEHVVVMSPWVVVE
jgi:hypothetical protein